MQTRIPVRTHSANLDRGARLVSSPREQISVYFTAGGFVATDSRGAVPGYFKTENAARVALGPAETVAAGMIVTDSAVCSAYNKSFYRVRSIEGGRAMARRFGHILPGPGGRLVFSGNKGKPRRNVATLQEWRP